jgi:hypothetical protein
MTVFQKYRLSYWEEVVGLLNKLDEENCYATIGAYNISLPPDLLIVLKPLLGKRIALLRSDNPYKQYLFRIIKEKPPFAEIGA